MPKRQHAIGKLCAALLVVAAISYGDGLLAQSNTRLLLSSGWGVPGHQGFAFGAITNLSMNETKEIVFNSTLRSAKLDLHAVVRSVGVTFSVVAFEGLRAPVPNYFYESFSAPKMNVRGQVVFTAALKGAEPTSVVVRVDESGAHRVIATSGGAAPGIASATFQEFSSPVITPNGNVLFAARTAGPHPGIGLFFSSPQGLQAVPLPADLRLGPKYLLEPVLARRDEAVFVPRGTAKDAAQDQLFRALAAQSFQSLNPPPAAEQTVEILTPRLTDKPITMLLVFFEEENIQTLTLTGNPGTTIVARVPAMGAVKPLGRIQAQTVGPEGKIVVAATAQADPSDLGLYFYTEGQLVRLTTADEFMSVVSLLRDRPISSLTSDAERTVAFLAPIGELGDSVAVYIVSLP